SRSSGISTWNGWISVYVSVVLMTTSPRHGNMTPVSPYALRVARSNSDPLCADSDHRLEQPRLAMTTPASDSGSGWLPFRQRRIRLRLIRGLKFDADAVSQRDLVANEHITIATPSPRHEDDARFVSYGEKAVGDAGWAVDEVPWPQLVLLAFDDDDTRAGENEEVFLVVELAVVLRAALPRLEHRQVVANLLEPTSVALERADVAHRLAGHPRQVADVCDERTIHTSSSRQEIADQADYQLRLAQGSPQRTSRDDNLSMRNY